MRTSGPLRILIILSVLFGSVSGYVLWPVCVRAFHGPFESAGYLIAWPASIAISLIPLLYFGSTYLMTIRKKSGFTFLFIANSMLLSVVVLFSMYLHLATVSSKVNAVEERFIELTYISIASVLIFLILCIWFFNRKDVRELFIAAS